MTASNQQIVIDEDELRAHVRALTAAAELLGSAATTAAGGCLLYTSPSPRDKRQSRMPSSA